MPETLLYFLLTMHFRSPLEFSFEALEEAEKGIRRVYSALEQTREALNKSKWSKAALPEEVMAEIEEAEKGWADAMEDDMNTAGALGYVFTLIRLAGRIGEEKAWRKSEGGRDAWLRILEDMKKWGEVMGIFTREPKEFLEELKLCMLERKGIDVAKVEELVAARQDARKNKDFSRSDEIRDELIELGIEVKDTPQGAVWSVI